MDIESFLNRTKRSKADLLRDLECDPKSSLVSAYIAGRSKPSYEMCEKLLKLGMTIKELFGDEIDAMVRLHYLNGLTPNQVLDKFDTPEFQAGVLKAFKEMKASGII